MIHYFLFIVHHSSFIAHCPLLDRSTVHFSGAVPNLPSLSDPAMLVSSYHHNAEVLAAQGAAVAVMHFIWGVRSKSGSRYGSAAQP